MDGSQVQVAWSILYRGDHKGSITRNALYLSQNVSQMELLSQRTFSYLERGARNGERIKRKAMIGAFVIRFVNCVCPIQCQSISRLTDLQLVCYGNFWIPGKRRFCNLPLKLVNILWWSYSNFLNLKSWNNYLLNSLLFLHVLWMEPWAKSLL